MGSVASYEASVIAVYERSVKVKKPNSKEVIEEFLDSKNGIFGKVLNEEVYIDDIDFENNEHLGYAYYYDGEDSYRYKSSGDIEEFIDEDCEYIRPIVAITEAELTYLDLDILQDFAYYDENDDFNENISLKYIHEGIYCSNDNSTRAKIKIPKKVLKDLVDGKCTLYLEGDGSGEHC